MVYHLWTDVQTDVQIYLPNPFKLQYINSAWYAYCSVKCT